MTTSLPDPSDLFPWLRLWSPQVAPQALAQSILQGWSLVSITENNSSAPDTERRIVEQDSYGRQIGRIMDVLAELTEGRPKSEAIAAFDDLRERVDKAKRQAAIDRLSRIRDDLALLKEEDPAAHEAQVAALRALLAI